MIHLHFEDRSYWLLRPSSSETGVPVRGWAGMRWMVLGPATAQATIEAIQKAYAEKHPTVPRDVAFDHQPVASGVSPDGFNLAQIYAAWELATALCDSKVCSERLEALCSGHMVSSWVWAQIQSVDQSVYRDYGTRRDEFRFGTVEEEHLFLAAWLNREKAATEVVPPPVVRELILLVLDHINWLAVQRFEEHVDFERDVGVASIWLGEFSGSVLRPPNLG